MTKEDVKELIFLAVYLIIVTSIAVFMTVCLCRLEKDIMNNYKNANIVVSPVGVITK